LNFEDSYKWASLKKKFVKATAPEIDFWEMALLWIALTVKFHMRIKEATR
jgi:hypothetical protein